MTTQMSRELAEKKPANDTTPTPVVIDGQAGRPLTAGQLWFLRIGALLLVGFALFNMVIASIHPH